MEQRPLPPVAGRGALGAVRETVVVEGASAERSGAYRRRDRRRAARAPTLSARADGRAGPAGSGFRHDRRSRACARRAGRRTTSASRAAACRARRSADGRAVRASSGTRTAATRCRRRCPRSSARAASGSSRRRAVGAHESQWRASAAAGTRAAPTSRPVRRLLEQQRTGEAESTRLPRRTGDADAWRACRLPRGVGVVSQPPPRKRRATEKRRRRAAGCTARWSAG